MAGILTTLFFLFSFQTQAIITDPNTSGYVDNTGTLIRKDQIDIKVYNNFGNSIASGSVVIWDTSSDNGVAITLPSTYSTEGIPAACVTVNEIADKKMGSCRIWGYHPGIRYSPYLGATTATAGHPIYLGQVPSRVVSFDRTKEGATASLGGVGVAPPNNYNIVPVGILLDTVTSTQNVEAFINVF